MLATVHVKRLLQCPVLTKIGMCYKILLKIPNNTKILPVGIVSVWTDGHGEAGSRYSLYKRVLNCGLLADFICFLLVPQ